MPIVEVLLLLVVNESEVRVAPTESFFALLV